MSIGIFNKASQMVPMHGDGCESVSRFNDSSLELFYWFQEEWVRGPRESSRNKSVLTL